VRFFKIEKVVTFLRFLVCFVRFLDLWGGHRKTVEVRMMKFSPYGSPISATDI